MNNEQSKANRNKERIQFIQLLIFLNPAKGSRYNKEQKHV